MGTFLDKCLPKQRQIEPTTTSFFIFYFLQCDWNERVGSDKALDCGAGIGRVSKHTLLPLFQSVDLVEQEQKFLDQAPVFLEEGASKVGKYICCGLQDFVPQPKHYDVIWCQWVLGHLTDEHLVSFFKRCRPGLKIGGIICVKENIAKEGVVYDDQDSSVTRSSRELMKIFKKAGLCVIKEEVQRNFPMEIYTVKMFALRWTRTSQWIIFKIYLLIYLVYLKCNKQIIFLTRCVFTYCFYCMFVLSLVKIRLNKFVEGNDWLKKSCSELFCW